MMLTSESLASLAKALSAAQGELTDANKSAFNPGFKSKYADLAEVLQTIRPIAAKNGLAFVQTLSSGEGYVRITTRLLHSSGEWLQGELDVPLTKKDAQGVGSATTYGRRYSIAALFGIAQDDDDAEATKKPKEKTQVQAPATQVDPEAANLVSALFNKATNKEEFEKATAEYAKLNATEQASVLGAAKAARTRVQGASSAARTVG
jgi:hypothetical protein